MSTIARFSVAEYDRMIDRGVFDPRDTRRLELIRGEIRQKCDVGPAHEHVADHLVEWSIRVFHEAKFRVRALHSIGLPDLESVVEPDVAWVELRDYSQARPTARDVFLILEIAESSLAYDTGEKADLYAAAGIADYWVVNVPERAIEVRRDPGASGYRSLRTFTGDDEVRPLAAPEIALRPSMLWPR